MSKKLSNVEIEKRYDSFSKWYDFLESIFEFPIIGKLRKDNLSKCYGRILDLAIGTGKNLKYYPKECEITGIDLSEGMLQVARQRAKKLNLNVKFIKGNSEKLPFKSNKFDFVVDSLGVCTYKNPIKVLKEMKRVVKINGAILLLEHGLSDVRIISKLQHIREKKHYQSVGCSLIRNPHELVKKAGLNITSVKRKIFGIFYLIEAKI